MEFLLLELGNTISLLNICETEHSLDIQDIQSINYYLKIMKNEQTQVNYNTATLQST